MSKGKNRIYAGFKFNYGNLIDNMSVRKEKKWKSSMKQRSGLPLCRFPIWPVAVNCKRRNHDKQEA